MEKGQRQPVFILMRNGTGAARFCAFSLIDVSDLGAVIDHAGPLPTRR